MKKMISILLAAICVIPVSACGSAAAASQLRETGVETMNAAPPSSDVTAFTDVPEEARDDSEKNGEANGGKTLVAYFSATGTTRTLAGYAAEALGADIYEIVPEQPYTQEDLAYYTDGRADREQSNPLARPVISGSALDMSRYHVIILGYPIWHGQALFWKAMILQERPLSHSALPTAAASVPVIRIFTLWQPGPIGYPAAVLQAAPQKVR